MRAASGISARGRWPTRSRREHKITPGVIPFGDIFLEGAAIQAQRSAQRRCLPQTQIANLRSPGIPPAGVSLLSQGERLKLSCVRDAVEATGRGSAIVTGTTRDPASPANQRPGAMRSTGPTRRTSRGMVTHREFWHNHTDGGKT
jgi:hypothetical protein